MVSRVALRLVICAFLLADAEQPHKQSRLTTEALAFQRAVENLGFGFPARALLLSQRQLVLLSELPRKQFSWKQPPSAVSLFNSGCTPT